MITLERLKEQLMFFNKMYDIVRLVDPVEKKVLDYQMNSLSQTDTVCYNYWENGQICDNCISIRAHYNNNSFMKLEQGPDFVMMVMAIPVEGAEQPAVLELLKNATNSMFFGSGNYTEGELISDLVSKINGMIVKDSLTSLYNRRFIDDRLPADIIKSALEDWPISVIMIDVDNLKEINDKYGHLAGDEVLKGLGSIIEEKTDTEFSWAARYGGDEFLICLNNVGTSQACRLADEIQSGLKQFISQFPAGKINPTLSIGICTAKGTLTAEEMINLADKQMYLAKRQGKNCIVFKNFVDKK